MTYPPLNIRLCWLLFLLPVGGCSPAQASDGPKAKSSPLYHPVEDQGPPPKIENGFFLGPTARVGQSRPTGSGTPGTGVLAGARFGYRQNVGFWDLFTAESEVWTGSVGTSEADLAVPFGFAVGMSHGSSFGRNYFSRFGLSAGVFQADYESLRAGETTSSSSLGNLLTLSAGLGLIASSDISLIFSFSYSHMNASFSGLKDPTGLPLASENVAINFIAAELGLFFGI